MRRLVGHFYRLPRAVDLLDKNAISAALTPAIRELIGPLEVLLTVDSTNRHVAEHAANPPGTTHVWRKCRTPVAAGAAAAG